jgi:hypothetical protein
MTPTKQLWDNGIVIKIETVIKIDWSADEVFAFIPNFEKNGGQPSLRAMLAVFSSLPSHYLLERGSDQLIPIMRRRTLFNQKERTYGRKREEIDV